MTSPGLWIARADGFWWSGTTRGTSWTGGDFAVGTTRPTAANTGLNVLGLTTSDLTVAGTPDLLINDAYVSANGSTLDRLWVKGHVTFTASTPVTVTNSRIEGRAFTGTAPLDAIVHARSTGTPTTARISFSNCVITCTQPDVGICTAAGERLGDFYRCDLSLGSDIIDYWSPASDVSVRGCYLHDYSFWDDDPKHTSDSVHPGWSHSDAIQVSGGDGITIEGNNFEHFAAHSVGGYSTLVGTTNYGNGAYGGVVIMTPSSGPITNLAVTNNWIHGGDYQIHLATQSGGSSNSGNSFTATGNRHGIDCHPAGPFSGKYNRIFYVWDQSMTSQTSTDVVHDNTYDDTDDVTADLQGIALPDVQLISGASQYQTFYQTSTP